MLTRRLVIGSLISFPAAAGQEYSYTLTVANATPAKWTIRQFRWDLVVSDFAFSCPVIGPDKKVAMTVVIVRIDTMLARGVFDRYPNLVVPDPVLLDNNGKNIGSLPEGFPVDPPGRLNVVFQNWSGTI